MSSFQKKGLRDNLNKNKKEVTKAHIDNFYKILNDLEVVANKLKEEDIEYSKENINEYASKHLGRDLDNTEKLVLLGKLEIYE